MRRPRCTLPDGTEVTSAANRLDTALPADLAPGAAVKVSAQVKSPVAGDPSDKREDFVLEWDLRNKVTGAWLSKTTGGVGTLDQNALSIWPVHKVDRGEPQIEWWPGESLSVPD